MPNSTLDDHFRQLVHAVSHDEILSRPFAKEPDVEREVWRIVWEHCGTCFPQEDPPGIVLSSQKSLGLPNRSAEKWAELLSSSLADLEVLEAKKRLDIVLQLPGKVTIGIEVECMSAQSPADQFIVGLGQSVLALAHRDRVLLVAHCGPNSSASRQLQEIANRINGDIPTWQEE